MRNWALVIVVVLMTGLYLQFQANQALCAMRNQELGRIDRSERYLEDVRTGRRDPIKGITEADIRQSITASEDTLRATAGLHCW